MDHSDHESELLIPVNVPEKKSADRLHNCPTQRRDKSSGWFDHRHWKQLVRDKRYILLWCLNQIVVFLIGVATTLVLLDFPKQFMRVATDFGPARVAVEQELVRYLGSPSFDEQGQPYLRDEDRSAYIGVRTKSVDSAWDDLVENRWFLISDEEALHAWGPNYTQYHRVAGADDYEGGYLASLDVLHSLHCVNMLRVALYRDEYADNSELGHSETWRRYLTDHCLELIRQTVQCKGDLTPIPTRYWPGLHRSFADTNQLHTCRNFGKIREWASRRWIEWHVISHPPTNHTSSNVTS